MPNLRMQEFRHLAEWGEWRKTVEGSVGFVPTMGALHAGHASLLERARAENDVVVLSVFVNPTQFNNPKDLESYPTTVSGDREIAAKAGVDALLLPLYEEIYPDSFRYKVSEKELSSRFCGAHRPGHFDGVLTVVMKLLNLVRPDRAYFGEKDYQQLKLIEGMVEAFFIRTQIVACPTLRESDGLAMSSRNLNLNPEERARAPQLARILKESSSAEIARTSLEQAGFKVDYVEEIGRRRLAAATIGNVRLIDNVER